VTITLPRPPQPPARHPFPLLAVLAPVAASVAVWAITTSPLALLFALLGPVVALAGAGDARRRARAEARAERARFEREVVAAIHAVELAHEKERAALDERHPSALARLSAPAHDPERWRTPPDGEVAVRLGTGRLASALVLAGDPGPADGEPGLALAGLREKAAALDAAAVVVDARLGIGVCGPPAPSVAAASAILVQLADALAPELVGVLAPRGAEGLDWVAGLPHAARDGSAHDGAGPSGAATVPDDRVEFRDRGGAVSIVVAVAADERSLPRECRVVLRVAGAAAELVRHPDRSLVGPLVPEFVAEREASAFAATLREAAGSRDGGGIPDAVAFAGTPRPRASGRGSLPACLGADAAGPVVVDLAREGPHAVIGGTTGSGKSELLVTWVLSMAAATDPALLSFLLVDFKGGASFGAVRDLPHTAGLVTDLDELLARRAILSLRAELRRRERILSAHGARSIDELADEVELARLVIVVDEYATLVSTAPEFHDLFSDLAARGRSLGIHLILCTQRPAGIVRDSVLANCTLGISLRVNNRADSVAVVGAPDAAALPRHPAGRAVLSRGDGSTTTLQLALAGPDDIAAVVAASGPVRSVPHRPWLDPLPAVLERGALPRVSAGIAFGLVDLPAEQRQTAAVFDPLVHGNLLVLGARGSGRSTALAALAADRDALVVPDSVEGAWDTVLGALDRLRGHGSGPRLILVDDVDAVLGSFPADHETAFLDALAALAREGPRAGASLVLAASSLGRRLQPLAGLCESTLLLRMPNRDEHVLAGGAAADYDAGLPPGRGRWRGQDVQVVLAERRAPAKAPSTAALETALGEPGSAIAVASAHPAAIAALLERRGTVTRLGPGPGGSAPVDGLEVRGGAAPHFVLGDPDDWQSSWALLGSLRARSPIVLHGCGVAEFRSLARTRALPPPIASPADTVWLLHPDGRVERARLTA
jgi:S-DNA-T family DNA segregation ATPase FtsK/SpoIIIE